MKRLARLIRMLGQVIALPFMGIAVFALITTERILDLISEDRQ